MLPRYLNEAEHHATNLMTEGIKTVIEDTTDLASAKVEEEEMDDESENESGSEDEEEDEEEDDDSSDGEVDEVRAIV